MVHSLASHTLAKAVLSTLRIRHEFSLQFAADYAYDTCGLPPECILSPAGSRKIAWFVQAQSVHVAVHASGSDESSDCSNCFHLQGWRCCPSSSSSNPIMFNGCHGRLGWNAALLRASKRLIKYGREQSCRCALRRYESLSGRLINGHRSRS